MKKTITFKEMEVGETFEGRFIIPQEKIDEYTRLFNREILSYTPPFLIMLYSFKPITNHYSIAPGTIHASQSFEYYVRTEDREFMTKGKVTDKFEKRGGRYIVITVSVYNNEQREVGRCSFRFLVPE